MNRASVLGTAALCLSAFGWTDLAHAAPCSGLTNPLVVSGSTAVQAVIAKVAPPLAAATGADQISVIYQGTGSCSGVAQLGLDVTPGAAGACAMGACLTGTASYWDATGAMKSCDLETTGTHIDLILSDVYKASCDGVTNPNLRDTNLLVIPFGLITAKGSTQEAIDAREGYYVFGRGMAAGITPWVNELLEFNRGSGSGTQITIFKNLHVPVGAAFGVKATGTGDMITKVSGATSAEQAIGFASLDAVDTKRDLVKTLAYRHWGQNKFYWPDSTNSTFDKRNVRDGHYPLWSYEHAITLVDGTGAPVSPLAKKFSDILSGTVALPGGDAVLLESKSGVIPLCAMEVARTADAGDFTVATSNACGCFFEKNAGAAGGTPDASCKSCVSDTDCSSGQHCRNTFCEAR
ncbi:MAG: hypothetical protein JWN04_6738 [Myxococcaceae bacterium]|nr:hypothetical protein [Myxococcaceae bacterium]